MEGREILPLIGNIVKGSAKSSTLKFEQYAFVDTVNQPCLQNQCSLNIFARPAMARPYYTATYEKDWKTQSLQNNKLQ